MRLGVFFISRFFRLYPAYWFSILLAVISIVFFLDKSVSAKQVLFNMTMMQTAFGVSDLFGAYWTLFIEVVFYGICVVVFALVAAYVRFVTEKNLPVALFIALALMFFGSIWRDYEENHLSKKYSLIWLIIFVPLNILICYLAYSKYSVGDNSFINYIISYTTAVLFLLLFTVKIQLKHTVFIFLGTISYSVYLIHPFFLNYVIGYTDMSLAFNVPYFIAYVIATVILAIFVYYAIEKPSIKIGKKIANHYR